MFVPRSAQPKWRWPGGVSRRWLAVLAVAPLLMSGAQATETWVGGVGSFYDATNWSGGFVPLPSDDILINNGGTVQSSNTADVANVSIGGGSTYAVLPGIASYFTPNNIFLGTSGSGTMTVGSEAFVSAGSDMFLGYASNSTGVVTMDGGYLSPYTTYVGYQGSGTMTLGNGATVQSTTGYVGYLPFSSGLVQLSDSTWKAEDGGVPVNIIVAAQGNGEIQASNSVISAGDFILGDINGSTGTVTAQGGTLTIGESVLVGNNGIGNLTLSNAATLTANSMAVGVLNFGNGIVTISGARADLSGELNVGAVGLGNLTLQGAGTMVSDSANVGDAQFSEGTVNVLSGIWTNKETMTIGASGDGALNIGATGTILTRNASIGKTVNGEGTVSITGAGALLDVTETLVVGETGSADVTLQQGGEISSDSSQIGLNSGSSGIVNLDFAEWTTMQTLTIGGAGVGEFTARSNSLVQAGAVVVGGAVGGQGTLRLEHSSLFTSSLTKGPGSGTVSFDGGTLLLAQTFVTPLFNGFNAGDVTIESGGIEIDTQNFSAGTSVPLSGAGGLVKSGSGTLVLDAVNTYAGGTLVAEGVLILVQGASGSGGITMGSGGLLGFGNMNLSTTPSVAIQDNQTAAFMAVAGQTFTVSPTNFSFGAGSTAAFGSATMDGSVVFAPGSFTASTNHAVAVQGGTLAAGNARLAELTESAAATTVASGATLDLQGGPTNSTIRALHGAGTVQTGTNPVANLTVNGGNFSGNISGSANLVKASTNTLTLSGSNSFFLGGVEVNGGTLLVEGALLFGLTTVSVNPGGTLGGSGLVGPVTLAGGTLAPGSSPGTFTASDLFWEGGTLRFELGPTPATSDHLTLDGGLVGLALPSGPYTFDFVDNGWTTNTYDLITFGSTSITNLGEFNYSNGGGFAGTFAYSGNTLQFTVTTVPEPGTLSLVACAAILGWVLRARRNRRTG